MTTLAEISALHSTGPEGACSSCGVTAPCPTRRLLDRNAPEVRPVHVSALAPGPLVSCDDLRAGDTCTAVWADVTCLGCHQARARLEQQGPCRVCGGQGSGCYPDRLHPGHWYCAWPLAPVRGMR